MVRCLTVTVAIMLALPCQARAAANIWLSGTGTVTPGSSFPINLAGVPVLQPYLAGTGTIYIWGRPDVGKSLVDLSLNLVAETQEICSPGCTTPNAITFTSATIYNDTFGTPSVKRFEYVDDSTTSPPLPIDANYVYGMDGLRIFETGNVPAIGIGNIADPRYDASHTSWLIAQVTYNALATGEGSETHLYLEIGPIGLNHADEPTSDCNVVFGDASDAALATLNGHDNRGVHPGNYDAIIRPRPFPGDADRNGVVNASDYSVWRANFGSTTQLAADHNANGKVDAADYVVWRKNLGLSAGFGAWAGIPEPSTGILLLIAAAARLAIGRRSFSRAK